MQETEKDLESEFKAGQSVKCRVVAAEPGGYHVKLIGSKIDGYLPSQEELQIGQAVPATFVCMNRNRALMTFAYRIGTTARVQAGLDSESATAFAVWADSHPRTFKLRRAIDIIMPPTKGKPEILRAGDYDVARLSHDLERSKLTGCLKAVSQQKYSRSAMLLFQGRAVGCIYGKKPQSDPYPTETALQMMLLDMSFPETSLQLYELPLEVVLPMSSLFLGCPVDEEATSTNERPQLNAALQSLKSKKTTACLTLHLNSGSELCFAFVHKGRYYGAYHVEGQKFESDVNLFRQLIENDKTATLEIHILPGEMLTDSVLFGYSIDSIITEMEEYPVH